MTDEPLRYQNRRASAATFASLNEVLLAGEIGVVKDADEFRIGDGTTAWNDLPAYQGTAAVIALVFPQLATLDRPDPADAATYFDTDLGKPAWSTGSAWVDATGTVI